ncbi:MAG: Mrp/NBP35 family ATP-binding protein [Anaerolineales bacterium]|nr:Mrp/NBP35 family ATP-binding protein [Anaerolineales bacterium]
MTDTTQVKREQVLEALSTVIEPELHRDLVSLKMIQNLEIDGGIVSFTIMLTTPACPLKERMEKEARAAVIKTPGVTEVRVKFDSNVTSDRRIVGKLSIPVRNTIAVTSGKGGVGKSTVSVNLAVALAQTGARVGLLDADILGPNLPMMMGVDKLPPPAGEKITPAFVSGVQLMSMGFLVPAGEPLVWRGPMLHSAIRQLLSDVAWEALDYMVIDLPPGTGDAQLSLAQSVPLTGAIVVTQPQNVALSDASKGLAMFTKLNVPILGVVENMSGEFFGEGGGKRLAEQYNVPFLGQVPLDSLVRISGDEGKPIVAQNPKSPAGKAFVEIAKRVAARISVLAFTQEQENG